MAASMQKPHHYLTNTETLFPEIHWFSFPENFGPEYNERPQGRAHRFAKRMSPEDMKYTFEVNILKLLAEKDKRYHIYDYHSATMPGTDEEVIHVEIVDNVVVIQSNTIVQFWRHLSGENYKKELELKRVFAKGRLIYTDKVRKRKNKKMLIHSDLWFIDGLTDMNNGDTTFVLHMCIYRNPGPKCTRLIPLRMNGKYVRAVHCVLPDGNVVLAATYWNSSIGNFSSRVYYFLIGPKMTNILMYALWGEIEGCVTSIGYPKQSKMNVVVFCEPYVAIFDIEEEKLYTANFSGTLHKITRQCKRQMVSVNMDSEQILYMTFRSDDGIVEEIARPLKGGVEKVFQRFNVNLNDESLTDDELSPMEIKKRIREHCSFAV